MAALARWCFRRPWVVVLIWVGVLFGAGGASGAVGTAYANVFSLPHTDSSKAFDLLTEGLPEQSGDADTVVWRVDQGTVRDDAVAHRMGAALDRIAGMKDVGRVVSPYAGKEGAGQVSKDGRIAYAQITFTKQANELSKGLIQDVVDTARAENRDGLQVELGGQAILLVQQPPMGTAEVVGIAAAAIVLFIAFGSLYAMSLPIIIAIFGVGIGSAGTILLSHTTDIPEFAPLLGSLIGLGVGIDYALFIVTRHRTAIRRGATPEDAAVSALNSAGRAVLFAGGTVCIALFGMFVVNLRFLNGVVIGTALTVVLSVAAAVTLLPALLGLLKLRVLSRRQRRRLVEHGPEPEVAGGLAARWSARVQQRPRIIGGIALVLMAALAIPVFSIRLGTTDQGNNSTDKTTRRAYDLLAEGFGPGFNGPLQLVTTISGPRDQAALTTMAERVRQSPGVAAAFAAPLRSGQQVGIIQVVPTTSPQSVETDRLIDRLRNEVIPAAQRGNDLDVHVGGVTAIFKDFSTVIGQKLPLFIASIIGLGFVLLLIAFRSLLVPLTAAVMNLLAAAASFGVLVAIFQWGWGLEEMGLGSPGPITAFLPVIMLSLLFGLSMDYQVFLVSRMHEEWVHTRDNRRAVRVGLAETSRVINSAAIIMICVFSAFVLSGDAQGAVAGVGLAAAVALDAFLLRTALVPALMHLMGKANWWLPAKIDTWLPHLAVEPADQGIRSGDDELAVADGSVSLDKDAVGDKVPGA